jgi:hypothetical protein
MATDGCFTPILAVRLRACLLDDTGAPLAGADSVVVTDALINIGYSVVLKAGADLEQDNGGGEVCATYQGDDEIKFVNLKLELISLLTGATLVEVAGITRGFAIPTVGAKLSRRASIEAWAIAQDGDEQALLNGNPMFYRYIFPRTSWTLGDQTLENKIGTVPLVGKGRANSQFGDGPANDLPWDAYTSAMGIFDDDSDLPDSVCGFQTLIAS